MDNNQRNNITLDSLATILGSTFLFNLAILLLWLCIILFAPEWFYKINAKWFNIGKHEFDVINYCGIGFLKIINIVFFLFPYLSIKLVLRKKKLNN